MFNPQSPPMNWDTRPTHTPCWSIWAPCASEQQSQLPTFQALTPPSKESTSKFWPIPQRQHVLPQSPPLTPQASPGYMQALSPDRSYLVAATAPLYLIKFKGDRLEVHQGAHPHFENELVIVEADRGQDLGRVHKAHISLDEAGQIRLKQHEERNAILLASGSKDPQSAATPATPNAILRAATNDEINQLPQKQSDELKAVAFCRQRVQERGLDMVVVDAEFQWDRRKLTFFYRAGHRVDFRDLVRELFRTYKTRIWMCAVS